jgi:hypothetical protein
MVTCSSRLIDRAEESMRFTLDIHNFFGKHGKQE